MHYANGRAAKIGDLIRGHGYNVKHEIVGRLITARPHESSCNCTVAYVGVNSEVRFTAYATPQSSDWLQTSNIHVTASLEYGQLDGFVAIDPNSGDVLEAEN